MAINLASILYKFIAGRYWSVCYPAIAARYRFIKNASWVYTFIFFPRVNEQLSFCFASAQLLVDKIKHLIRLLARSSRYQSVHENFSKYFTRFKGYDHFHIFTYFASA